MDNLQFETSESILLGSCIGVTILIENNTQKAPKKTTSQHPETKEQRMDNNTHTHTHTHTHTYIYMCVCVCRQDKNKKKGDIVEIRQCIDDDAQEIDDVWKDVSLY